MKLCIYIPTYNRPHSLYKQLSVLVPQVNSHKEHARLIVNDNDSPSSDYGNLAKEFENDNVCFLKNPGNIGPNANIALGFISAKMDEFLWIVSDDDFVSEKAIETILPVLKYDTDLISIFDYESYKEEMHYWTEDWEVVCEPVGLITSGVYNMKTFSKHISSAFYFHNTSFPHLAVVLSAIKAAGKLKYAYLPRKSVFVYGRPDGPLDRPPSINTYGLSLAGLPLISVLMPQEVANKFCWKWLKLYWSGFYEQEDGPYSFVFHNTLSLLKERGIKFRAFLFLMNIRFHINLLLLVWFQRLPSFFRKAVSKTLLKHKSALEFLLGFKSQG